MEVFAHITQRKDRHICIKFADNNPPSKSLIQLLKSHGRHRPIGNGLRAWQFKSNSWRRLQHDLIQAQHGDIALAMHRIEKQWRASDREERAGGIVEESESTGSDAE